MQDVVQISDILGQLEMTLTEENGPGSGKAPVGQCALIASVIETKQAFFGNASIAKSGYCPSGCRAPGAEARAPEVVPGFKDRSMQGRFAISSQHDILRALLLFLRVPCAKRPMELLGAMKRCCQKLAAAYHFLIIVFLAMVKTSPQALVVAL